MTLNKELELFLAIKEYNMVWTLEAEKVKTF